MEGVGSELLLEAIKKTRKKMIRTGEEVDRSREGAVSFFDRVLEENFIQPYYDPHSKPIVYPSSGMTSTGNVLNQTAAWNGQLTYI